MASEHWPGSVKLRCAFIKHNYWYLLPSWIQSARLDFITSVPWKGFALCTCSPTPSYRLIYALTTHRHMAANNRVCGQWGPRGLRSSLGEHRGASSNGNKKNQNTHPSSPRCELCFSSALRLPWTCTGMIDLRVCNEARTICAQSWE